MERPESQTHPRAGTARFTCVAEGMPRPRVTWLKNGHELHSNGRMKTYNRYTTLCVCVCVCVCLVYVCVHV